MNIIWMTRRELVELLTNIKKIADVVVATSDDFRAGMGPEWKGDPLTDVIDQLREEVKKIDLTPYKGL